jgi:hypothetical protein
VQGRDNSDYVIRRNHHARQQRNAAGLFRYLFPPTAHKDRIDLIKTKTADKEEKHLR